MKIDEQVLSIEQMKHLQELGVDTSDASMVWIKQDSTLLPDNIKELWLVDTYHDFLKPMVEQEDSDFVQTYTIGDLIEKLPKNIDGSCLLIEFCASDLGYGDWDCGELYGINAQQKFNDKSLKEALYDLLCWVAENHKELLEVKK